MYFHMGLVPWWRWLLILAMVVVVDDFDSGFVDFGYGGGMMFEFFFSFVGLMAMVVAMVVVMAMVWWYGV